jgi:diguanylate cyclase (GGDEF)-like protein
MKVRECLRALGRAHTFNPMGNECLRAGLLLGLVATIPLLLIEEIRFHPISILLLAYPALIGIAFGMMGTIRKDQELRHERDMATLSSLAMTDPLTGLYNRRYVEEELKNLLHRTERTGAPVSVVFFDLDHFKQVNLNRGHRGGDLMLKMVAEALQSVLRQGEILGRYGGDEFLLVVAADLPYAANLVERAVAAVKLWTQLSVSAGVARSRDDGNTPEDRGGGRAPREGPGEASRGGESFPSFPVLKPNSRGIPDPPDYFPSKLVQCGHPREVARAT